MSKSIIYAGNSTAQATVSTGTTAQFNNIVRRFGPNVDISGGNVVATGSGYYEGIVNLNIEGAEAGTGAITVYANGTAIPFATASFITTTTSLANVVVPFVVRNTCNCMPTTITVVVSGVAANVSSAAIVVEKE